MARTKAKAPTLPLATSRALQVERDLEAWIARAVPDASTPLDADDIARLVRDCFASFDIDPAAGDSFSVNTVHYYRRKDILDEPEGRTSAARYSVRHLWQAIGARLAGYLGLVTLAEARRAFRGADETTLRRFVADRLAEAHGRQETRRASLTTSDARPLSVDLPPNHTAAVIPLGGNAMCLIPAGHAALHSTAGADALVDALATALRAASEGR